MGAHAFRIDEDRVGSLEQWAATLSSDRGKPNFDDMNRRHGLTGHRMWLTTLEGVGRTVVVVLDGPGADRFFEKVAVSEHPYDRSYLETLNGMVREEVTRSETRVLMDFRIR